MEALTDRIEEDAERIFARIEEMGGGADARHEIGPMTSGILRGIEDGWFMAEIADAAFEYQRALEKGDKQVVGVNVATSTDERPLEILRVSHEVETAQNKLLGERRTARDQEAVDAALARMVGAARGTDNLIEPMLAAVRAEATLGEICGALREEWGAYAEPPRF